MGLEFLAPLKEEVVAFSKSLNTYTIGYNVVKHTVEAGVPALDDVNIAIIGVGEYRNSYLGEDAIFPDVYNIRKEFYQLFPGNWRLKIADLGDVVPGAGVSDTYYVVKELVSTLVKQNVLPIIIGGSQDITYAMYRAYDNLDQMVNLVSVDNKFDLVFEGEGLNSRSYLNNIIQDEPVNLFNYANIGYQTYYNSQEGLDIMDKLFFDVYRLGEVVNDMPVIEPVLRDADIVSVDMTAVQGNDLGGVPGTYPNGFTSREICAVARYAGISDKVSSFGVFDAVPHEKCFQLTAQVLWYFVEGYNYRYNEYPFGLKTNFVKYIVPMEEEEINFYKSDKSERWWIEVPIFLGGDNNFVKETLIPCSGKDYMDACNQIVPERWWKAYKKSIN